MAITIANPNKRYVREEASIQLRFRLFWDFTIRIVSVGFAASQSERLPNVSLIMGQIKNHSSNSVYREGNCYYRLWCSLTLADKLEIVQVSISLIFK